MFGMETGRMPRKTPIGLCPAELLAHDFASQLDLRLGIGQHHGVPVPPSPRAAVCTTPACFCPVVRSVPPIGLPWVRRASAPMVAALAETGGDAAGGGGGGGGGAGGGEGANRPINTSADDPKSDSGAFGLPSSPSTDVADRLAAQARRAGRDTGGTRGGAGLGPHLLYFPRHAGDVAEVVRRQHPCPHEGRLLAFGSAE